MNKKKAKKLDSSEHKKTLKFKKDVFCVFVWDFIYKNSFINILTAYFVKWGKDGKKNIICL